MCAEYTLLYLRPLLFVKRLLFTPQERFVEYSFACCACAATLYGTVAVGYFIKFKFNMLFAEFPFKFNLYRATEIFSSSRDGMVFYFRLQNLISLNLTKIEIAYSITLFHDFLAFFLTNLIRNFCSRMSSVYNFVEMNCMIMSCHSW